MYHIGPGQSTTLFFRIVPVSPSLQRDVRTKLFYTKCCLSQQYAIRDLAEVAPCYDFLEREKAYWVEKNRAEKLKILTPGGHHSAFHHKQETEKNKDLPIPSELDLILLWETTVSEMVADSNNHRLVLIGQQNICNLALLNSATVDQVVADDNPLRFTIDSPRKILHDFNRQSFCMVPVTFHVNNCSSAVPISFYLHTLKPNEQLNTAPSSPATSANDPSSAAMKRSQYFWSETSTHYVRDLPPESKILLDCCVCFSKAGIYNLNRYKFCLEDEKSQTIYSQFQHMIIIEDTNETLPSV